MSLNSQSFGLLTYGVKKGNSKKPTSTIWTIDFMVFKRAKYESAPTNLAIDSSFQPFGLWTFELKSF